MTVVKQLLRWSPLVAIAIELGHLYGWVAAASFIGIAFTIRKYGFISVIAAVLLVWLGHVRYTVMLEGAAYRLLWVTFIDAVFRITRNRPPRLASVVPRLRCGHGLQARIQAADQALQQRFGATALDAYLAILADHPIGRCDRALYLRSAEAAVLAGNARLALELAEAAVRDLQGEPVGQLATILVRAHAIQARAYLLLRDIAGATKAIRAAQRGTQADRSTDRYLRWAAADVYLAGRPVKSNNEVTHDLSNAIVGQQLTLRPDEALGRCLLNTGWRALDAGLPEAAFDLTVIAIESVKLGSRFVQTLVETGKRRIPRRRVTAWHLYCDAITLQVAAMARTGSHRNASGDDAVNRATSAAVQFDDPWATARLMFEHARWSIRNGKTTASVGLLQQALNLGDYRLHTFSDTVRQADWVAIRSEIAATLTEITGQPGTAFIGAWPPTPGHLQRRQAASAAALELFGRLRQRDSEVFTTAHARALAAISDHPPVMMPQVNPTDVRARQQPAHEPRLPAVRASDLSTQPISEPPAAPGAVSQVTPARSKPDPGPAWLHEVLASGPGERCWAVYQAFLLAQAMGHSHVSPEHLVPVLLAERPIASLIAEFAISPADLRAAVGARFGAVGGTPDLDPRLERFLAAAAAEATRWGERRVRPTWLMLAMLREPSNAGTALLESHGVDRQEFFVRLLAATVSSSSLVRAPLFAIDNLVGPYRLTAPTRLVLAAAIDLATAESGLLGVDHLRAAAQRYDWSASSPEIVAPKPRERVKVTGSARTALRTALRFARSHGISGIGLDHLRQAIGADARPHKEFSPAAQAMIRAAHGRVESQNRCYFHLGDLRWALEGNPTQQGPDTCFGLPPVLTPHVEQAIAAAEHVATKRVEVDDLRTALKMMRAAQ
jgi:Clp amino terminal domain, pathogenicity island component